MSNAVKSPRKLIEVALPLDAINVAAVREKAIRHGHPSTLHLWWARRPLAAARAVIFAQLVNDPGYQQGGGFRYGRNKKEAAIERKRLFKIIEDLVQWENTTNEEVLDRARAEIRRSWREVCELNEDHPQAAELFNADKLPALHDPFAGGGTIPLEAQRLGLEAYASDLNPVAVLINKAMIEIPPKFAGQAPVGPLPANERDACLDLPTVWPGATGLAEDVRRYGAWIRDEAEKRIGHLYPKIEITAELATVRPDLKAHVGNKLTVIAWLWARTVKSPNPAFSQIQVPLASTFMLATKEGRQAYVEPLVEDGGYRFTVRTGKPRDVAAAKNGTKLSRANFRCLMSGAPISQAYIMGEGQAGRIGARLMAIVAEGERGRVYLPPSDEMELIARSATPVWKPDVEFFQHALGFRVGNYGMTKWSDLFTSRQIVALTTLCDLVQEARGQILNGAIAAGMPDDGKRLSQGGTGAAAYVDAMAVYLGLVVSRLVNLNNALCQWRNDPAKEHVGHLFARQAIPMVWDFAEANPIGQSGGSYDKTFGYVPKVLLFLPAGSPGCAVQADAAVQSISVGKVVSTDPPYYDNVGYADLSDFFYVWLRRTLKPVFPDLFTTRAVPKAEELVATPYRHGGKEEAESFFLNGMTQAMHRLAEQAHPGFPVTIYYAFKQAESDGAEGTSSTGWETFLDAVIRAGFATTGTWPVRTELANRMRGADSNALASSIVLVCRKRPSDAVTVSRREFLRELNAVLPEALDEMTKGSGGERSPVDPVDLSQAIIGPGMAVFSKYFAVLEADGSPMSVRTALQLINRFLAEDDFDPDTQFCLHWFQQHGWSEGRFGDADTLSRAKGTSVDGVRDAGVVESGGGKVRLRKWSEYPADWDPQRDVRQPVWETLHHLIRALRHEGESSAGRLLSAVKGKAEATRQLAYRLYTLCERQGWAEDARAYNELITSWAAIESASGEVTTPEPKFPGFEG
jgi:putative DNA methylase